MHVCFYVYLSKKYLLALLFQILKFLFLIVGFICYGCSYASQAPFNGVENFCSKICFSGSRVLCDWILCVVDVSVFVSYFGCVAKVAKRIVNYVYVKY